MKNTNSKNTENQKTSQLRIYLYRPTRAIVDFTWSNSPSSKVEYLAGSLTISASLWRASFNKSWDKNTARKQRKRGFTDSSRFRLTRECYLIAAINKTHKLYDERNMYVRYEHWSLTMIMSSRAFSTFSLAWFIRLDIWLWEREEKSMSNLAADMNM